jgi:hypothetical protein
MNSLKTIYFPVTELYSIRQYPLFLLFQNVHLIQPVEKSPAINSGDRENSFISSGLCHVHTPCPLGKDRDRFLHLVKSIRERKDDYASQLSSLTLTELSRSTVADGESERDIAKAIFAPKESPAKMEPRPEKREQLWKSRLVLAIAEVLDLEQEEIARNLAELEDEEKDLFQSLHGDDSPEDDSPLAELTQLEKNLAQADSRAEKNRTRAWMTLFAEAEARDFEVLLTTSADSADIILERYEETHLSRPIRLTELELPGLIGWNSAEALQAVTAFSKEYGQLLDRFSSILLGISKHESPTPEQPASNSFKEFSLAWQAALEYSFPAAKFGRDTVSIYLLAAASAEDLLLQRTASGPGRCNTLMVLVR